jgi:hypothetical protein
MSGLNAPGAGDFDTRQHAVFSDPALQAYRQKNPGLLFSQGSKNMNPLSSEYDPTAAKLYAEAVDKAKKAGYYGPQAAGAPAAAAAAAAAPAAAIETPTNAASITAGQTGTLGLDATKKKTGGASPTGFLQTILSDLGGYSERLGG